MSEGILDRTQLAKLCSDFDFRPSRQIINLSRVPAHLHVFQPYAEIWGIDDVDDQYHLAQSTPRQIRRHVALVLNGATYMALSAWLGGDDATALGNDPGYVALSNLVQCADIMEGMAEE